MATYKVNSHENLIPHITDTVGDLEQIISPILSSVASCVNCRQNYPTLKICTWAEMKHGKILQSEN